MARMGLCDVLSPGLFSKPPCPQKADSLGQAGAQHVTQGGVWGLPPAACGCPASASLLPSLRLASQHEARVPSSLGSCNLSVNVRGLHGAQPCFLWWQVEIPSDLGRPFRMPALSPELG